MAKEELDGPDKSHAEGTNEANDEVLDENADAESNYQVEFNKKTSEVFFSTVQAPGLPNIHSSRKQTKKIIWLIIYLILLVFCVLWCYNVLAQYFSYSLATSVVVTYPSMLDFPAITVCDTNRLNRHLIHEVDGELLDIKTLDNYMWPKVYGNLVNRFPDLYKDELQKACGELNYTMCKNRRMCYDASEHGCEDVPESQLLSKMFDCTDGSDEHNDVCGHRISEPAIQNFTNATMLDPVTGLHVRADTKYLDDEVPLRLLLDRSISPTYLDVYAQLKHTKKQLKENSLGIQNLVLQCTMDQEWCPLVYEEFFDDIVGMCYTYNTGMVVPGYEHEGERPVRTFRTGHGSGLGLTLYVPEDSYIGFLTSDIGAIIQIHPWNVKPNPAKEGFFVGPGISTHVGMRMEKTLRCGEPYTDCINDWPDKLNYPNSHKYVYDHNTCVDYCLATEVVRQCGCTDSLLFEDEQVRDCKNDDNEDQLCTLNTRFNMQKHKSYEDVCGCKTACEETSYRLAISTNKWPAKVYSPLLLNDLVYMPCFYKQLFTSNLSAIFYVSDT